MRERRPGVWEVRAFVGRDPVTNAPRQVSRTVHGGKRAAQTAMASLVTEAKEGKLGGTDATVGLLLDHYLAHLERRSLSPKTLHTYRQQVDTNIRPALGSKAVRKLTAWDLDGFYASLTDAGRSAKTVRNHHVILSGALGQAVKWGWCPTNVAKMASPPTVHVPRIEPPTVAEVQALVKAATQRNPILAALVMLAAIIGARRGELCALRWPDVDLAAGTLRISRSMLDIPGLVEEKPTKTYAERTLSLGEAGAALLQLHRAQADKLARVGEVDLAPDAFVFSEHLDGATPVRPDKVTRFFTLVRDEVRLPHVHLHSLRHFVATQLAASGEISVRTAAGRLGWADASVFLRVYASWLPAADLEAAEHLGRALTLAP
jgi:integrase